ncbi:MAG: multidrug effflux MFS transporter [Sphingobium sp.]|uniref:multidrug effflux MFS transporter n=1 Tax=Sphingobium sp. TaxID=1912891 RepID=UPI0029A0DB0A|nr:multidrug effflux MFS transporter [Sphingobium sp.]MDX3908327.1 multidrug effflux MFS transporter [Sphingobium sp.]
MQHLPHSTPPAHFRLGFKEFVALIAALMATNALSIDPMLPALPAIGETLNVPHANDRQWIVTAYFLGLGIGSLIYGPLSDRFGRKPIMGISLVLLALSTGFCAMSQSFAMMLAARFACGFFAAATRVIAISIVRDRFHGDQMARIMSLIFIVFMVVPILAPSFGQAVLLVAPWRWIFWALLIVTVLITLWMLIRLPETLDPANRVEVRVGDLKSTLWTIVTNRGSIGHMLASGVVLGGLVGFITSVQQIFFDVFHEEARFPLAFALIAGFMGVGSFLNSHLVERIGARRLSQGSLLAMIMISATHAYYTWSGLETVFSFIVFQAATMLSFAFTGSNFSAISMEPFARGAGMASSFQAFLTTIVSALLGAAVGWQFNGTTLPLALGFLCYGLLAFLIVAWAERWQLFRRRRLADHRENAVSPR